jgi:enoyl-CoA hydratase/carnithine racemase
VDSASLQDAMEANYESVQAMIKSEDFIEGPKAFSEKRPPRWQGK